MRNLCFEEAVYAASIPLRRARVHRRCEARCRQLKHLNQAQRISPSVATASDELQARQKHGLA
eukprot:341530-Pleurochrysis_carterae.AAC.1